MCRNLIENANDLIDIFKAIPTREIFQVTKKWAYEDKACKNDYYLVFHEELS